MAGVPIDIIRGRRGGICLPDTYRLPSNFFTKEEYAAAVNALGGCCAISNDDLLITGSPTLAGGIVDAAGDHRIAMMAAVMATRCTGPTTIVGAECVSKSYPNFFKDFSSLGGVVETEA